MDRKEYCLLCGKKGGQNYVVECRACERNILLCMKCLDSKDLQKELDNMVCMECEDSFRKVCNIIMNKKSRYIECGNCYTYMKRVDMYFCFKCRVYTCNRCYKGCAKCLNSE